MRIMAAGFDLPPIFLLPTHIDDGKLAQLQSQIPTLTFDIGKACIILGNIFKKERAIFELRRRNVNTTEIHLNTNTDFHPPFKQRKLSTTRFEAECDVSNIAAGEDENPTSKGQVGRHKMDSNRSYTELHPPDVIKVIQLDWFTKSVAKGQVLPTHDYLIYQGHKELQISQTQIEQQLNPADILRRARAEGENVPIPQTFAHGSTNVFKTQTSPRRSAGSSQHPRTSIPSKRPPLLLETTTEHDIDEDLPPIPEFLHTTYSCERPTPFSPPNDTFIDELKRIRTTRLLTGDKVGVRAYSSCIASLAAYPYALKSQQGMKRQRLCSAPTNFSCRGRKATELRPQDSSALSRMEGDRPDRGERECS